MRMHNPPHPGEFIRETFLEPNSLSARAVAIQLKVSPSTFGRLLNGDNGVSADMAYRLSEVLGVSPESWLAMQNRYDLWVTRDVPKRYKLKRLELGNVQASQHPSS